MSGIELPFDPPPSHFRCEKYPSRIFTPDEAPMITQTFLDLLVGFLLGLQLKKKPWARSYRTHFFRPVITNDFSHIPCTQRMMRSQKKQNKIPHARKEGRINRFLPPPSAGKVPFFYHTITLQDKNSLFGHFFGTNGTRKTTESAGDCEREKSLPAPHLFRSGIRNQT